MWEVQAYHIITTVFISVMITPERHAIFVRDLGHRAVYLDFIKGKASFVEPISMALLYKASQIQNKYIKK